jgi:DNA-directed RNA polymerase subunit RPC12/RpoP
MIAAKPNQHGKGHLAAMQIPDGPDVSCPWCGGAISLARFAASDEEEGVEVAVCTECGRRVVLPLPQIG